MYFISFEKYFRNEKKPTSKQLYLSQWYNFLPRFQVKKKSNSNSCLFSFSFADFHRNLGTVQDLVGMWVGNVEWLTPLSWWVARAHGHTACDGSQSKQAVAVYELYWSYLACGYRINAWLTKRTKELLTKRCIRL